MNVLYFLDWFPKLSQSFVLNEIYYLRRRGHDVAVFSINEPDERLTHEEYDELTVPVGYADPPSVTGAVRTVTVPSTFHPRILRSMAFPASPRTHLGSMYLAGQCIDFVESLDWTPDIVHTHFARGNKFGAVHVGEYYGVPCTLTTHAYDLFSPPNLKTVERLGNRVDRIVTISEYNRAYIRDDLAIDTPVEVIRAGIRPEKFAPSGGTQPGRILTVSRLVEKKGVDYAIDAVGEAVEDHPEITYHIVGTGEREPELRERIGDRGLEATVSLLGTVSDERLVSEFDEAAAFLLPCVVDEGGDRDGIPVVLMEAMAMRVPPITTTVSGIPELVEHRENGLVVDPRNTEALAAAIDELIGDERLRMALGETARETIEDRFDAETTTRRLEQMFESTVATA